MYRITYKDIIYHVYYQKHIRENVFLILGIYIVLSKSKGSAIPANTKHLHSICTTSSTLVQHCTNMIQMFCVHWDATTTHSSNAGTMLLQRRKGKYVFAPLRKGVVCVHTYMLKQGPRTQELGLPAARAMSTCTRPARLRENLTRGLRVPQTRAGGLPAQVSNLYHSIWSERYNFASRHNDGMHLESPDL